MTPQPAPPSPQDQAAAYLKKANLLPRPGDVYGPPKPGFQFNPKTMDAVGGDHPFATTQSTRFVQTKLRQMGLYNGAIDGIAGPLTMAAYQHAYGKNYNPTKNNPPAPRGPGHGTPPPPPHDLPPGGPGGNTLPPPPPGRTTTSAGKTDPVTAKILDALGHLINPQQYAHAAADASYDPRISGLVRQMTQEGADQKSQQGDIANWYAALMGQAGASHDSDQAAYKDLIGASGDASKGLIDSLGGSASPAAALAAAQATTGTDELAGLSLADLAGANARKDSYAQQGVGQRLLSQRAYNQQKLNDLGNLADLRSAKGDEYTKDLENAYGIQGNQAKNLMNARITAALAGPQLDAANLANDTAKTNLKIANWRLQMGIKQSAAAGAGGTPDFQKQDPTKLSSFLLQGTLGPRGNFNQNPVDIYNRMNSMLKTVSYGKYDSASDPRVKQFLIGLVNAHLSAWNRQNPQNRYAVKGGKVVHI